jgi:glycosyltransferase involved in cell wall biosynthesis
MQLLDTASVPLSLQQKFVLCRRLGKLKVREYLTNDSFLFKKLSAILGLVIGLTLLTLGKKLRGCAVLSWLHRADYSDQANKIIAALFQRNINSQDNKKTPTAQLVYQEYIENLASTPATSRFFVDPQRLLGTKLLVLKAPQKNEKGVIVVDYSFALPLLAKFFDIYQIAEQYYLVLEPSWSGYCDLDILCYAQYDFPVFVQSFEPRDATFIRHTQSNLIPVPTAANWWIDHRMMQPLPTIKKDVDIIMIASWARFKRHQWFFSSLRRLQQSKGEKPRVVLVGYPTDCTRDDIFMLAKYFGVHKQIEMYEWLSPEEVNQQLNRAKVNVVWSRKEGVNRAIIEGMFAGVPCILRDGFNYGYHYPYINSQTGCFASERHLSQQLLWMIQNYHQFSPREWVMANMTCQHATKIIGEAIQHIALEKGENWTQDLAVKVGYLNGMCYWDNSDMQKFEADYTFLQSTLKR